MKNLQIYKFPKKKYKMSYKLKKNCAIIMSLVVTFVASSVTSCQNENVYKNKKTNANYYSDENNFNNESSIQHKIYTKVYNMKNS